MGQSLRQLPGLGNPCEPGWLSLRYGIPTLWLFGEGELRKGTMLLPGLWSFVQEDAVPSHSPYSFQLRPFLPHATGTFPAAVPVLEPRGEESALNHKWGMRPLRRNAWKSCCPNPYWFLQPEVMGTYLPDTGTLAGWSSVWLGLLSPEVTLPIFIHYLWVWDCPFCFSTDSASLPLLLVWMNVTSLILWFLDVHTAWFSDNSGW